MDNPRYQCVVVGLGAVGSAALYQLTRRGVRTLGIEQFHLGHDRGSSHGNTRAFRTTYEDALYSRMGSEALEMWRSLESDVGEKLLELVGLLGFADQDNRRFLQNLAGLKSLGLPHEILSGPQAAKRYDAFTFGKNIVAFFAQRNGFLHANRCLRAMQELAIRGGADVLEQTVVRHLEPAEEGFILRVGGQCIFAERVVITAGPWLGHLVADLNVPLKITREQKVYFAVDEPERFRVGRLPVFVDYETDIYGFPLQGPGGMKVAADHTGRSVDPDQVIRTVDPEYVDRLRAWIERWMPTANPRPISSAVCLYTCTPDLDFIIDRHPLMDNVVIAGGFSGHGFKFSILVGDIVAELATEGTTKHPIERFGLGRFLERATAGDDP